MEVLDEPPRVMEMRVEHGRWSDARTGAALPLDGCVDIDIYPSPFTNTLPIRRLADAPVGQPVRITVAWVHLPTQTVRVAAQDYTLRHRATASARWRFRALDSDFATEFDVDAMGVVRDYPDLARRVLSLHARPATRARPSSRSIRRQHPALEDR
jgi:hypothetical protein